MLFLILNIIIVITRDLLRLVASVWARLRAAALESVPVCRIGSSVLTAGEALGLALSGIPTDYGSSSK